ncbi:hypothetical protein OG875_18750 [Streptomyces sp. NBC_01498]|uniref:hypothetical protein n=1 Tax=Streptomyces sp. NBC_01498 TaxID=2975870 RepID=UPI002E7B8FC0|nr:hypothetical protein [Streptomyces sp. NBC_01498]WTL26445.1 hypothetical protein OG875_18750 [Streptomyces sp. NBC_01498]
MTDVTEQHSCGCAGGPQTVNVYRPRGIAVGAHICQHNMPSSGKQTVALVKAVVVTVAVVVSIVLVAGSGTPVEPVRRDTTDASHATDRRTTPPLPGPLPKPTTPESPTPSPSSSPSALPPVPPPAPAPALSTQAPLPTTAPIADVPDTRPTPGPTSTLACPPRERYRVTGRGQIWDIRGQQLGEVASGTLFFREEPASYPSPVDDRYYGTVKDVITGSPTGYVLRKKLAFVDTVEYCG